MTATPPDVHPNGRYNTVQTAQLLGIGRTTLWRLSNAGILKPRHEKHSGKARYRGKDILAYWKAEF